MPEPRVRAFDPPRMAILVDAIEHQLSSSGTMHDRTYTVLEHRHTKHITITSGGCMSDSVHRALAWIRVPRNTDVVQDCHIEHALLIPHEQADQEDAERAQVGWVSSGWTLSGGPVWTAPAGTPPPAAATVGTPTVSTAQIERVEQLVTEQGFALEPWQRGWLRWALDRVLGGGR